MNALDMVYVSMIRKLVLYQKMYLLLRPFSPYLMTIFFLMHDYRPNNGLVSWWGGNWCGSSQHDSEFQNVCTQMFHFKIIFAPSVFEIYVSSGVFTYLLLHHYTTRSCPKIRLSPDGVKKVKASLTGNLWSYAYIGS